VRDNKPFDAAEIIRLLSRMISAASTGLKLYNGVADCWIAGAGALAVAVQIFSIFDEK